MGRQQIVIATVVFGAALLIQGGTMLTVVESGLDKIPLARRATVFRLNSSGWDEQMRNVEKHVATK